MLLKHEHEDARRHACNVFADHADVLDTLEYVGDLMRCLDDESEAVRTSARAALDKVGPPETWMRVSRFSQSAAADAAVVCPERPEDDELFGPTMRASRFSLFGGTGGRFSRLSSRTSSN